MHYLLVLQVHIDVGSEFLYIVALYVKEIIARPFHTRMSCLHCSFSDQLYTPQADPNCPLETGLSVLK